MYGCEINGPRKNRLLSDWSIVERNTSTHSPTLGLICKCLGSIGKQYGNSLMVLYFTSSGYNLTLIREPSLSSTTDYTSHNLNNN